MKVKVELDREEWTAVLRCIVNRQNQCRYVQQDDPTYKTYHALDLELEALKMRLANQIPSIERKSR